MKEEPIEDEDVVTGLEFMEEIQQLIPDSKDREEFYNKATSEWQESYKDPNTKNFCEGLTKTVVERDTIFKFKIDFWFCYVKSTNQLVFKLHIVMPGDSEYKNFKKITYFDMKETAMLAAQVVVNIYMTRLRVMQTLSEVLGVEPTTNKGKN